MFFSTQPRNRRSPKTTSANNYDQLEHRQLLAGDLGVSDLVAPTTPLPPIAETTSNLTSGDRSSHSLNLLGNDLPFSQNVLLADSPTFSFNQSLPDFEDGGEHPKRIIVPAYFGQVPDVGDEWRDLADRNVPGVTEVYAIANIGRGHSSIGGGQVNGGPLIPENWDIPITEAFYADVMNYSQERGVKIFGYISTQFGERPLGDVFADIAAWKEFDEVSGIFLDEQAAGTSDFPNLAADKLGYYIAIRTEIERVFGKSTSATSDPLVISNPGNVGVTPDELEPYLVEDENGDSQVADIMVIFEGSTATQFLPQDWMEHYSPERFMGIVHSTQDFNTALSHLDTDLVGNLYLTQRTTDVNVFMKLSDHWDALATWVTEENRQHAIELPRTYDLEEINRGIASADGAAGNGYLMYTIETVASRFGVDVNPFNAEHLVPVRLQNSQWQFRSLETTGWIDFTPEPRDRLVATVDFSRDTVANLQGTDTAIEGIAAGYVAGDLQFSANRWNGANNRGEFGVTGSFVTVIEPDQVYVSIEAAASGIAADDAATGTGYLMFSNRPLDERFGNMIDPDNASRLLTVRWNGNQWQLSNLDGVGWTTFTPETGDRLIASVDFDVDRVTMLRGIDETIEGVAAGYLTGDLVITANRWNGQRDFGDFGVSGRFFTIAEDPDRINIGPLNRGIAVADAAVGQGFLMYSATRIQDRFGADVNPFQADFLIAVRRLGNQWQFSSLETTGWLSFTPSSGDRLMAEVDFSNDTVTSLQGTSETIGGIEAGYASGDLVFSANRWNDSDNLGEFGVSGTHFRI